MANFVELLLIFGKLNLCLSNRLILNLKISIQFCKKFCVQLFRKIIMQIFIRLRIRGRREGPILRSLQSEAPWWSSGGRDARRWRFSKFPSRIVSRWSWSSCSRGSDQRKGGKRRRFSWTCRRRGGERCENSIWKNGRPGEAYYQNFPANCFKTPLYPRKLLLWRRINKLRHVRSLFNTLWVMEDFWRWRAVVLVVGGGSCQSSRSWVQWTTSFAQASRPSS